MGERDDIRSRDRALAHCVLSYKTGHVRLGNIGSGLLGGILYKETMIAYKSLNRADRAVRGSRPD